MKRVSSIFGLLFVGFLLSHTFIKGQVASTICLDETREIFKQIDPQVLMGSGGAKVLAYHHSYVMKMDPKQETREADERRWYGKNYYKVDSPDELVTGDASETFTFRKFQNVIYRTNASLDKAGLVPMASPELFDYCLVRECHFVPAPGQDSISYKRAYMTVDAAGQKKFQIKDIEFVFNPHDGTLISLKVNHTDRSLFKWSAYQFERIENLIKPLSASASEEFLGGGSELKADFEGVTLHDYRR